MNEDLRVDLFYGSVMVFTDKKSYPKYSFPLSNMIYENDVPVRLNTTSVFCSKGLIEMLSELSKAEISFVEKEVIRQYPGYFWGKSINYLNMSDNVKDKIKELLNDFSIVKYGYAYFFIKFGEVVYVDGYEGGMGVPFEDPYTYPEKLMEYCHVEEWYIVEEDNNHEDSFVYIGDGIYVPKAEVEKGKRK